MGSVRHMLWALTFGSEEECKYFKNYKLNLPLNLSKITTKKMVPRLILEYLTDFVLQT
jgi:hypothetical protein